MTPDQFLTDRDWLHAGETERREALSRFVAAQVSAALDLMVLDWFLAQPAWEIVRMRVASVRAFEYADQERVTAALSQIDSMQNESCAAWSLASFAREAA